MLTSSPMPSTSWIARTVTSCGTPQLPELPCVKLRLPWLPGVPASVSTSTELVSPEATARVTPAPGSVRSDTR